VLIVPEPHRALAVPSMPEVIVAYVQFLTARSDRDAFAHECVEQHAMSAATALRTRVCALPHCRTAALPHCRTAALPHRRTACPHNGEPMSLQTALTPRRKDAKRSVRTGPSYHTRNQRTAVGTARAKGVPTALVLASLAGDAAEMRAERLASFRLGVTSVCALKQLRRSNGNRTPPTLERAPGARILLCIAIER
jgi:hypothetical protein